MIPTQDVADSLLSVAQLKLTREAPLSQYTRFGIGGPAKILADAADEATFLQALAVARECGVPLMVIGGGTNLIVSDAGFSGLVLRYTGSRIRRVGDDIEVEAGAVLQDLVNASIEMGLEGLHTMTGIPGWVGAAVYGNAGAYGHSISEFATSVRYHDGREVRDFDNAGCCFAYRESIFKKHKEWIILSARLSLPRGDRDLLRENAARILAIRNAKYPPEMKCAGSIFKNLILAGLEENVRKQVPASVVREGKVPSAWFLEEVGAKGMRRGGIEVAPYHANLIYNTGQGTAAELRGLISELKRRVSERFGLMLEEEVQYVGF
ncbi:MAG: UDP-N-acetylmuramate dehydrogenase [Bryobacteraceae bacterium]|nr:UDP-N-acetylmuramate dehydrogenase [Bryobacteraceae bacterium]